MESEIPVLKPESTLDDIKSYLTWLGQSPYAYHIDDDPTDIPTFTPEVQTILKANAEIMWTHPDTTQHNLWDFYVPKIDTEEGK